MELSIASLYIIINSTFSTLLREANWVEWEKRSKMIAISGQWERSKSWNIDGGNSVRDCFDSSTKHPSLSFENMFKTPISLKLKDLWSFWVSHFLSLSFPTFIHPLCQIISALSFHTLSIRQYRSISLSLPFHTRTGFAHYLRVPEEA
jgi:hypothetical protein